MRRSTALVAGWCVSATLLAAAAQQQQPTFRGGVEIFHLDVSVLDKNRRPVRGLTAADFTVLEDGKPAKVVALTDVELPAALPPPATWTHEVTPDVTSNQIDERRLFVMVLDDASMPTDIRQDILAAERSVKRIANDIVDRLGPQDLMAIVFTADNRRPQDFTNDRPKLKAAIDRFTRVGGLSVPIAMQMSIEVLVRAAEFLIDIPERRKALLYLGVGVPVDGELAAGPMRIGSPNEFIPMQKRELHIRAVQRMTDMLAAAERANVNVYSFDARGLRTSPRSLEVEFMQTISNHTGGRAFINTNDFGRGVEQLFRENASYYIVGYESVAEKGPGHWRRLDVRVNRPDVEARARDEALHGFAAATAAECGAATRDDAGARRAPAPPRHPAHGDARALRDSGAQGPHVGGGRPRHRTTGQQRHRRRIAARSRVAGQRVRSGGTSPRITDLSRAGAARRRERRWCAGRARRAHGFEAGRLSAAPRAPRRDVEDERQHLRRHRGAGLRNGAGVALRCPVHVQRRTAVGAARRSRAARADSANVGARVPPAGSRSRESTRAAGRVRSCR